MNRNRVHVGELKRPAVVKSADRVFQLLEYIGMRKEGCTHKEISGALGIPKSSLSLLLANLVEREYLVHNEMGKQYRLGPQVLILAGRYLNGLDIVQLGQPLLQQITIAVDEASEIAVLRGSEIMIICKEESSRPVSRVIQIGDRAPIYATAAGKAMLAHLPENEVRNYLATVELKPITGTTITDPRVLEKELQEVRSGGLARSNEELNEGIVALALPVFDVYGRPAASVVVPVPTIRFDRDKEKAIERVLRRVTTALSHKSGYDTPSAGSGEAMNREGDFPGTALGRVE